MSVVAAQSLTVRPVLTTADKRQFVRLLWSVYKDDPNWVAPLEMDRMKLMDEKNNPFYTHAESQFWIAERNGVPVGRIAAIVNKTHNETHNDTIGFFGFFESIDDIEVARVLLREAEEFLRSKGMTTAMGPASPSSNDEFGLLIAGFDRPPVLLMTYNPPYYQRLLESCGYTKAKDMYAWLLTQAKSRSPKLERVTKAMRERSKVDIRSFNTKDFDREVNTIKSLYNLAWVKNWGYLPMTDAEIDFMAKDLKQIYDPSLVLFAEADGKTVGFALSLPDINQAFRAGPKIPKGLLNLPIGIWNLLTKKKQIDTVRIVTLGVLPEYRGRGIDAMLYWETMERAKAKGYEFGEASWVLEDNIPMTRAATMMNGDRYKTYRVFEKSLVEKSQVEKSIG